MSNTGQNTKQKRTRSDSLIEVLRGFGSSTVKGLGEDFLGQIPKDASVQTGLRPSQESGEFSTEDFLFLKKQKGLEKRLRQSETLRHQEKVIYNSKQRETETKVTVLIEEVKKLSSSLQTFQQNVGISAIQAPVNPGIYHVNFFEKLITFIKSLSRSVEDANLWLNNAQKRSKKRSHYWNQVQNSGTKFMLSQERYMSTQVG
ncbi:MAG: DUF5660 domain-containing protein [bacterium]|nr:DUF5660 domain-containing protein [bacterium]